MIEDVHIIKIHALQALIKAGDQILAAAMVAVRTLPHIVTGLGGDDQLVAMRLPVAQHVDAKVPLGFAIGRAIVIG